MPLLHTRFLQPGDLPSLLALEGAKWGAHQTADSDALLQRIARYPQFCVGTFCTESNKALASLFLRPVNAAMFTAPVRWKETADSVADHATFVPPTSSLFGISLSSINAAAVNAIFEFMYPHLLKEGWRDIYLGSPIPGFRKAKARNPGLSAWEYVHARRTLHRDEPLDPQLCYYYRKGFRQIVSIHKDYFPHEESLDYGVIMKCVIPLSRPRALGRAIPEQVLRGMSKVLLRFA